MKCMYDMHCHSKYSEDTEADPREMCLSAYKKGLEGLAFTEHVDYNPADKGYGYFRKESCLKGLGALRREFEGRLKVLLGMEFSEPHLYPTDFKREAEADWDVIIGSVHMIGDLFVGDPAIRDRHTLESLNNEYYSIMLAMVKQGGFDILGHMDFPKRYYGRSPLPENIIDEILGIAAEKGIALEINTSLLRKNSNESCPGLELLKRFSTAGGTRITFGSDAHSPGEIAADFGAAQRLAASLPLLVPGYFEKRVFIPL